MSSRYKIAAGLSYQEGIDDCPSLSVRARAETADAVVKLARRFNVPVVERPELARALTSLELDDRIPEQLFEAVAVLLAEICSATSPLLRKR